MRFSLYPLVSAQRWMIAVAIVAILLGIKLEMDRQSSPERDRRSRYYTSLAHQHNRLSDKYWHRLLALGGDPMSLDGVSPTARGPLGDIRRAKAMWSYHMSLSWKYQSAARYPWLPVAPDPPEPGLPE
jgi:hypothetical protein